MIEYYEQLGPMFRLALVSAVSVAIGVLIGKAVEWVARRQDDHTSEPRAGIVIVRHCGTPISVLLPLTLLYLYLPVEIIQTGSGAILHVIQIALIATTTWLTVRFLIATEEIVLRRLDIDKPDNLRARSLQTQFRVLRRIAIAVVILLGTVGMLLTIEQFRELGAGLLASAGIASIVIGFAAQRTLANLLAGFQIAFTQPIRLDDVLVVEGEWGRVEEITLTYVVVAIWDQRRLVLPISYFLEHPFQNWTRQTAELLGTVYIYTDYNVDIDDLRAALKRFAEESEHFDGRVCLLQVTDVKERVIELRALVSAGSSGAAWDLRCEIREKLIRHLRDNQPDALPVIRLERSD